MYACNEHYSATEPRIAEETEMQQASIDGLKEVTQGVYQLAQTIIDASIADNQLISRSLLLSHSLYLAASELGWLIIKINCKEYVERLKVVVNLLNVMAGSWRVDCKTLCISLGRLNCLTSF